MVKMQYVHPEVIGTEGFEGTAAENVFVTPDGDVAIVDGNQAILIKPDKETPMVVNKERQYLKDIQHELLSEQIWLKTILDFYQRGENEIAELILKALPKK